MTESIRSFSWFQTDLDRCEHGRHSIDHCLECPNGKSSGNQFLLDHEHTMPSKTGEDGSILVRIGTSVGGQPIWVAAWREPR